jgi:integrase/recombinase XerD
VRLVFSDQSLVVHGRSYVGFPLLIRADGHAVEPAQSFLWDELASNGRAQSPLTWNKYGRDIYDYFAFLEANDLDWRAPPVRGLPGNMDLYRDWSRGEIGLQPRTINSRLRLVARFYKWAQEAGLIGQLPFRYRMVRVSRSPGFLSHVKEDTRTSAALRSTLSEHTAPPKYLSMDQVVACLKHLPNLTHRLMFELMVRCGLRQVECRTFPFKYLCNPAKRADLRGRQMIRMALSPSDMKLKYDKPREIDMPFDLMDDLWWYAVRHRRKREEAQPADRRCSSVFLTEGGKAYGNTALTDTFAALQKRVGFHVRPHMLRHTYGTYTLWRLRRAGFQGEPLLYVRDRMGHSSVTTTSIYLHMINQLDAQLVLQYEDEIDGLFKIEEPK